MCEKDYIWNATCSCENGVHSCNNTMITCDEIIDAEETKTVTKCLNKKTYNL